MCSTEHIFLFLKSGILHYDRLNAFADVLASVGTFLKAVENLIPVNGGKRIGCFLCNFVYRSEVELVAFLLDVVAFDNERVQSLGFFEVFKLLYDFSQHITALNKIFCKIDCSGVNYLDVIDKEFLENFLHSVNNVVELLAEQVKVLTVNGGYECFCKGTSD